MTTKIRIAARLRPSIVGEIIDDAVGVENDENGSFVTMSHPRDTTQRFKFPFSSCYGQDSTQEQIYSNDVKPLLNIVFSGVTVTVFAYGVTSSGKTHTIQGTKTQPGIIPRIVRDVFERAVTVQDAEINVSVSYMEIYKEEAYDLLVDRDSAPKLPIREDAAGQVFVAHLSFIPIQSASYFDKIYNAATKRRSVGSTNLNHASSRSHAILTLHVQMMDHTAGQTVTGKINLVDLAGSENNKLTGNDPSRMAESAAINKSLSVLGQVVHALNQGASRIPYRNSKLTRILQDALGGTAVGLLICNLAPGAKFRQDTWNTLNFATRTKEIENKPVVNVRDNQPPPKPHFGTLAPQLPSLPSANVPSSSRQSGRPSLLPTAASSSKLPGPSKGRVSSFGVGGPGGFQPFAMGDQIIGPGVAKKEKRDSAGSSERGNNSGSGILGLTEEEIDERIARAVEIEVARRLEERERRREAEEKKEVENLVTVQEESHPSTPEVILPDDLTRSRPPTAMSQLPSGVLTPLLKRHEDLDKELKRRIAELEQKYEQNSREVQLADVLSPASKKKTGRAYVALARAHSEKGNLQVALDLYKKAESYVPENVKLKERIAEVRQAVENRVEYIPRPRKKKANSNTAKNANENSAVDRGSIPETTAAEHDSHDGDSDNYYCTSGSLDDARCSPSKTKAKGTSTRNKPAPLKEATNSPQKQKRVADGDSELDEAKTPPKKQKKEKGAKGANYGSGVESDEERGEDSEWLLGNGKTLET